MSSEKLRPYGELSRDDSTLPERVTLLEEHAELSPTGDAAS